MRADGFSLLEMLVVLAIVAAVAAVALPRLQGGTEGALAIRAARGLADELRLLRAAAIRSNAESWLAIGADHRSLATSGGPGRQLPEGIRAASETGRIRFFPDGSSTGGEIAVASRARTLVVRVDWLTGAVRVAEARP